MNTNPAQLLALVIAIASYQLLTHSTGVRGSVLQASGSVHPEERAMVSETVGLHRSKARESPFKRKQESRQVSHSQQTALSSPDSSSADNEDGETRSQEQTNHERRLLHYLTRDYDNSIRPVRDAKSPVVIKLGITLTQIVDLDEKNQVLTTNVWLDQEWMDDFLSWESDQFGNMTKIKVPCEKIWLPDIVLYNSADDYTRGYMNSRAMIEPSGNVFWPPPTKFRSTCPVDVTYFPFDDQTCIMKLGSWIYDGLQVDILNRTAEVDLSNYVSNGEWDLLDTTLVRNVVFYSCCPEPFPDVTITIRIRRKTLYYMYNVVFPCLMMSVLTLLVFWLPPDSGEKIELGVTVLLAFSVFMLTISEKLPETSESIPLLGIYLTAVMAITSVSVIMTVIVINIHYRGPSRSLPQCVRDFLLNHMIDKEKDGGVVIGGERKSSVAPPDLAVHHGWRAKDPTILSPPRKAGDERESVFVSESSGTRHDVSRKSKSIRSSSMSTGTTFSPRHRNNIQINSRTRSRDEELISNFETTTLPSFPTLDARMSLLPQTASFDQRATPDPCPRRQWKHSVSKKKDRACKNRLNLRHQQNGEATDPMDNLWLESSHLSSSAIRSPNFVGNHVSHPLQEAADQETSQSHESLFQNISHSTEGQSEEMLRILRFMIRKQEEDEIQARRAMEWRLLALAIDKILFWIFLVVTLASSTIFLLYIPIQRRGLGFLFG